MQLLRKAKRPQFMICKEMIVSGIFDVGARANKDVWISNLQASSAVVPRNRYGSRTCFVSNLMTWPVLVQSRDPERLCEEILISLDEHRYSDALLLFEKHEHMEGLPPKSVLNKLVTSLAESLNVNWLQKAVGLVEQLLDAQKEEYLDDKCLIYLSFCLAKCELSVAASTVLRRLIKMKFYPPVAAWSAILAHMCMTGPGASLAAELVAEIGYLFQDGRVDPRKKINASLIAMKPNTDAVTIALAGCLHFGMTMKAEKLLDILPSINIKPNENTLTVMAHIFMRNGRREELKKLQRHIDEAFGLSDDQFRQFYNCVLVCMMKLGDLDAVSDMVLKMIRKSKQARNSLATVNLRLRLDNFSVPPQSPGCCVNCLPNSDKKFTENGKVIAFEELLRDPKFAMFEAETKEILSHLLNKLDLEAELLTTRRGILQPTEELYVKLAKSFLEAGKTKELTLFLVKVEQEDCPASHDSSFIVQVINSCISIGWLDQAHDLLDEMRLAGVRVGSAVYSLLLKEYCQSNKLVEAQSLLRDARRAGVQLDSRSYEMLIKCKVGEKDDHGALLLFKEMKQAKLSKGGHPEFGLLVKGPDESGVMSKLLHEIKEGQTADSGVHYWNNVIHFFCKKRLMDDAARAFERMKSLGHSPNAQTFHSLVTGYAALGGKYLEVTELWGEIKSMASLPSSNPLTLDQELLDSILYTFVRGGFFVRANEVVDLMEKRKMFIDKYKYRALFLKYHRTLCKGKASKSQSEAQIKRRDSVINFKKWVGLL